MKRIVTCLIILASLFFISNTVVAGSADHEDTIKRVGIMIYPSYSTLYILTNTGKEYSYSSNLHPNGIDNLKSMEAHALYAKAASKTIMLRTTGETNESGYYVLWGIIVEE